MKDQYHVLDDPVQPIEPDLESVGRAFEDIKRMWDETAVIFGIRTTPMLLRYPLDSEATDA